MTAVLMPTSSPRALTSAPPELPTLIAASVWMKSSKAVMPSWPRPVALTMPIVTVWLKPERVADREHDVADLERVGAAEADLGQVRQVDLAAARARCRDRCRRAAARPHGRRPSCTRISSASRITCQFVTT